MTRIKICGLSEVKHAVSASTSGADFIGMVFAPGKRQVSVEEASPIVKEAKNVNPDIVTVGVFVNSSVDEINRIADKCRLDRVQLSGDESWEFCRQIKIPIIKAIHITADSKIEEIVEYMKKGLDLLKGKDLIYLLDSKVGDKYGGTGRTFDWQIARAAAEEVPFFVAGGLNPDNVRLLIKEVRPWGVDVSSGVEIDGKKDTGKIKAFIEEVKKRR